MELILLNHSKANPIGAISLYRVLARHSAGAKALVNHEGRGILGKELILITLTPLVPTPLVLAEEPDAVILHVRICLGAPR